ncbi:MAG TPA: ATP-binding protein [Terracidiphilus sp.]|nr:ATP-binding protein [Terracidiphilus sp.]
MRGLFFKVFIIFWIAQSLIFIISTSFVLRHRYQPSPDVLRASLFAELRNQGSDVALAFESGGCGAVRDFAVAHREELQLEDASGRLLCTAGQVPAAQIASPATGQITGTQVNNQYVWRVPVRSGDNQQYQMLLNVGHVPERHTWYDDLLHFAFPQLPVAIAVGGVTTFVLVLIFTRPVVRLRKAARALAGGKLDTRVPEEGSQWLIFKGDEFHALVHDFNHMAERLESLVDVQKLLLRDVSHELRSPLARLSVALELAREDAGEAMTAHLDRIERETGRLNQLIGQLLELSSMEAMEKTGNFERISLNQLVASMIPDADYEARQHQCSVRFSAESDVAIQGKPELLYRAVENVVRNAIRYTEPGTEVEIKVARGSNGWAVLEVSDHGPGIPEAEIQSIFRPFYRVDQARSPGTGGFGVGLAIAERAVKLHKGELIAFNRKGGGATIQMRFPAA